MSTKINMKTSMKMMMTILEKEFKSYFSGPMGYVFLVIFLGGIGHLTFELGRGSFFFMREASLDAFFNYIPWMFLFLIPAVSMRLWAEERKSGTIELLLTMPLTLMNAILGKYFAALLFTCVALFLTFPLILTVGYLGDPDWGALLMGHVASLFLAAMMIAISGFFSALTKNQVVSFILSVVFCLLFLMAGSPPVLGAISALFSFSSTLSSFVSDLFEGLSMLNRFESMQRGIFGLSDLWFLIFIVSPMILGTYFLLEDNKGE